LRQEEQRVESEILNFEVYVIMFREVRSQKEVLSVVRITIGKEVDKNKLRDVNLHINILQSPGTSTSK